jgi:hypothetical protein
MVKIHGALGMVAQGPDVDGFCLEVLSAPPSPLERGRVWVGADTGRLTFIGGTSTAPVIKEVLSQGEINISLTPGWDYSPLETLLGSSAPPISQWNGNLYLPAFQDAVTLVQAYYFGRVAYNRKAGTDIYPMFGWTHNVAAPTGSVRYGIDWQVIKPNGTIVSGAVTGILSSVPPRYGLKNVVLGSVIPGANVSNGDAIVLRLYREGKGTGDTFTGSAFITGAQLIYESDSFGAVTAP